MTATMTATREATRLEVHPGEPAESDGLTPQEVWETTDVHQASRYSCSRCGASLPDSHSFYTHLAALHPSALS